MTLLKGNVLDSTKAKSVNLLLRKHVTKKKFDEIVIGDAKTLNQYYDKIKEYIDESINPNK